MFLKSIIFVLLTLSTVSINFAQGIQFAEGSWEDIVKLSKAENKPIFVDAYTTWCGPCKWMAKNTFTDEEVGSFFSSKFIAYKMDMEKGEGPAFAKVNNVRAYPTLLYFDSEGGLIHKVVGAKDAKGLIEVSNVALDPEKRMSAFVAKYNSGVRDQAFMEEYLTMLLNMYEDISAPFKVYWDQLKEDEKFSESAFNIMVNANNNFNSFEGPQFEFFMNHLEDYKKSIDPATVDQVYNNSYRNNIYRLARMKDEKTQKAALKVLKSYFTDKQKECKLYLDYVLCSMGQKEDPAKFRKAQEKYMKICDDWQILNGEAWDVFENEEDIKRINAALDWVTRSIEIEENYYNTDTKAALLYSAKQYEEAKKFALLAIEHGNKVGMDVSSTEELLENIKKEL